MALLIAALAALGPPLHAQASVSIRFNSPSYVPGDSGTLFYTIANTGTGALSIKNITIYFPWAGYGPDNKWQGNVSINFFPWKLLSPVGGGTSTYFNQTTFTVPSWFGSVFFQSHDCGNSRVRYGLFVGCILLGTDSSTRFDITDLSVPIAQAVYTLPSLVSQALPIATLVVLVIATAFLFLAWTSLRRLETKK